RGAAVLVIAHFGAVKIEVSVWLVADLTGERDDRRNLPIKTSTSPNLGVRDYCVVEARDAVSISKLIVHTESRVPDGCPCIKRYIPGEFVLQARRWQDSIQQPLWPYFPANTCGRNHRVRSFHIDAYAKDKLQVRAVNVRAADDKRHIEIIPKQMTETGIVQARLSFRSDENGIGQLRIESDNRAEGLQCIGQGGALWQAK